jgi:hypothetical protein
MHRYPPHPAIAIDAHAPSNCVHPWQDRLARPISMPHTMNPQPSLLQQVISLLPAARLTLEEPHQSRAKRPD